MRLFIDFQFHFFLHNILKIHYIFLSCSFSIFRSFLLSIFLPFSRTNFHPSRVSSHTSKLIRIIPSNFRFYFQMESLNRNQEHLAKEKAERNMENKNFSEKESELLKNLNEKEVRINMLNDDLASKDTEIAEFKTQIGEVRLDGWNKP